VTKVARRTLTLLGAALLAVAGWVGCDLNPQQLPPGASAGSPSDGGSQNEPPPNVGADASASPDSSVPPHGGDAGEGGAEGTTGDAGDAGDAGEMGDAGDSGEAGDSGDAGETGYADAGPDQ
jgi:hypothetical protein